jgi:shikimate dehydrogenase
MTDRYCVFGNPIAHSRSPQIHAAFARQTGQDMAYEARLAPLDGFEPALTAFAAEGGRGCNVTVPFKEQAWRLCPDRSLRAAVARAVNAVSIEGDRLFGDNTDGAGLVRDLTVNLAFPLEDRRILLLGAGGAARGVILPLLEHAPASLTLANRSEDKARALAEEFARSAREIDLLVVPGQLEACGFAALEGRKFDLVINATSASLGDARLELPEHLYAEGGLAYDMVYGRGMTPFLKAADEEGAERFADGLGMLVEQAAESFYLWRGVRPDTAPVLAELRQHH